MGLESSDREIPTATFDELQAFRAKPIEMGFPSLATAALIGWEWLQREVDIFATFEVAHYRPKEQPNAVRIVHEKTREENWIPLFDDQTGAPFSPVLMAELDAIKKTRIAGLMLRRDASMFPKEDEIDLTHMSRKVNDGAFKVTVADLATRTLMKLPSSTARSGRSHKAARSRSTFPTASTMFMVVSSPSIARMAAAR